MEKKIKEALEKIFRFYKNFQWSIAKNLRLSPIQIQFLIYLNKAKKSRRKVSNLSLEFGLKASTISDSIKTLEEKNLVYKEKNLKDKRNLYINLTKKSKNILRKINKFDLLLLNSIKKLENKEKEEFLIILLNLLKNIQEENSSLLIRFCYNCKNFIKNGKNGYICTLTGKKLEVPDINLNCNFHEKAK